MNDVFGPGYAGVYDLLYSEKDYETETTLLEGVFRAHRRRVNTVLDIGCGTGAHSIRLSMDGYQVTGVDRSATMIAQAESKAMTQRVAIDWHQADARGLNLGRRFDAAIMMFATLGYQTSNDDVLAALASVRQHLEPGGVFVFDVWYGPAVLFNRPKPRCRVVQLHSGQVVRSSCPSLDMAHHVCTVRFRVQRIEQDRLVDEIEEAHPMRFFFPLELALLLKLSGLQLNQLKAFPDFDREPSDETWNVVGVATAI
jgi:SAM-dependent methyltransferase